MYRRRLGQWNPVGFQGNDATIHKKIAKPAYKKLTDNHAPIPPLILCALSAFLLHLSKDALTVLQLDVPLI